MTIPEKPRFSERYRALEGGAHQHPDYNQHQGKEFFYVVKIGQMRVFDIKI